jgi:hypothetical protein
LLLVPPVGDAGADSEVLEQDNRRAGVLPRDVGNDSVDGHRVPTHAAVPDWDHETKHTAPAHHVQHFGEWPSELVCGVRHAPQRAQQFVEGRLIEAQLADSGRHAVASFYRALQRAR